MEQYHTYYIVLGSADLTNQKVKLFYKIMHYSVWYPYFYKQNVTKTNICLMTPVANIEINIKQN